MTKEQKTEVARLVFQLATLAMLSFMMLHRACAQPNWRILVERDTMAIGPLNDVRKWAGLRMAKNDMARQCAWELAQRGKELSSLYAERDACWDTVNEAKKVMDAMREAGVDIITIGQYLQPTDKQLPIHRYVTPEEFKAFESAGQSKGFHYVESGPLVRSSYHAWKHTGELVHPTDTDWAIPEIAATLN